MKTPKIPRKLPVLLFLTAVLFFVFFFGAEQEKVYATHGPVDDDAPAVSVEVTPASPTTADTVEVEGWALDTNSGVTEINVWLYRSSPFALIETKKCSFSALLVARTCIISRDPGSLTADTYEMAANAKDAHGNVRATAIPNKTFTVTVTAATPAITTTSVGGDTTCSGSPCTYQTSDTTPEVKVSTNVSVTICAIDENDLAWLSMDPANNCAKDGTGKNHTCQSPTTFPPGTNRKLYVACFDGTNQNTEANNADITFEVTGAGGAPVISNQSANVSGLSANLSANVNPNGSATTAWFRYSSADPGVCDAAFDTDAAATQVPVPVVDLGSGTEDIGFARIIDSLSGNTTYYYCAIAESSQGKTYGTLGNFTTAAAAVNSGSIVINGRDATTTNPNVTLTLSCSGECGVMRISNTLAGLITATSEGFSPMKNWTLSAGEGTKAVYVQFLKPGSSWWPVGGYADNIELVAAGTFEITPTTFPLDCGTTTVGTPIITCKFQAVNTSGSAVTINSVTSSNPTEFTPNFSTPLTVNDGEKEDLPITFNATTAGSPHTGVIQFTTTGGILRDIEGTANPSGGPVPPGPVPPGPVPPGPVPGPGVITFKNPLGATSFTDLVNRLIDFIFTVAVIVAPILLVIAGVIFMTAAGDPTRVATARRMLLWTIVGFGIILISKGLVEVLKGILGI